MNKQRVCEFFWLLTGCAAQFFFLLLQVSFVAGWCSVLNFFFFFDSRHQIPVLQRLPRVVVSSLVVFQLPYCPRPLCAFALGGAKGAVRFMDGFRAVERRATLTVRSANDFPRKAVGKKKKGERPFTSTHGFHAQKENIVQTQRGVRREKLARVEYFFSLLPHNAHSSGGARHTHGRAPQ